MKLIFATHNKNKFEEVRRLMPNNVQLGDLKGIGCREDIPETGKTLEDNALIKADYVCRNYSFNCFADDTGLEIDALGGMPGVYSARYAGIEKNDGDNVRKVLNKLKGVTNRSACFKTIVALCMGETPYFFKGIIKGHITEFPKGDRGFGYDSIFIPEGNDLTFAEMTMKEKNRNSHRQKAITDLIHFFEKTEI